MIRKKVNVSLMYIIRVKLAWTLRDSERKKLRSWPGREGKKKGGRGREGQREGGREQTKEGN